MDKTIGRSIRLFLVDGAAAGLIVAEIVNWTGKIIVVPRAALAKFLARPEAINAGVYLLSGPDPEEPLRSIVYVGETEGVGSRLRRHDKDDQKEFYERAIVCVSKDENLTKAHVRYLEGRLVAKVLEAGRAKCSNDTSPGLSPLPEADRSDMEFFISQLELVLPVLGLDILRPQIALPKWKSDTDATHAEGDITEPKIVLDHTSFVMKDLGVNAEAQEVNNEFIIKAGSTGKLQNNVATAEATALIRKQYLDDGVFSKNDETTFTLTKDVAASSPSRAANILYGGNVNGRWYWKVKNTGKSYGEWREELLSPESIAETKI